MMLMSSVAGHGLNLKRVPSIHSLKPKPFSHFLLPPSSHRNNFSTSSTTVTTIALFKSKTKAPVKVSFSCLHLNQYFGLCIYIVRLF